MNALKSCEYFNPKHFIVPCFFYYSQAIIKMKVLKIFSKIMNNVLIRIMIININIK